MPVFTAENVIYEAAGDIAVIEPGEALSPEDYETLSKKYDGLIGTLAGLRIYIPNKNEVDETVFTVLARMLANVAGAGVVGAALNQDAWDRDLRLLRQIIAPDLARDVLRVDFF